MYVCMFPCQFHGYGDWLNLTIPSGVRSGVTYVPCLLLKERVLWEFYVLFCFMFLYTYM